MKKLGETIRIYVSGFKERDCHISSYGVVILTPNGEIRNINKAIPNITPNRVVMQGIVDSLKSIFIEDTPITVICRLDYIATNFSKYLKIKDISERNLKGVPNGDLWIEICLLKNDIDFTIKSVSRNSGDEENLYMLDLATNNAMNT